MKEFGKLWKINRNFYLSVLVIVLLLVAWDSIYICNDERIAFTGKSIQQMVVENLDNKSEAKTVSLFYLSDIADEKMHDMTLFGTTWTYGGIILLLVVKYFAYTDARMRETQMTWPVRKWKRNLFDYFAMLFVIVIGWATEVLVVFTVGNRYNNMVMHVLMERSLDTSTVLNMEAENQKFLLLMSIYLLYMILFYTFVFMGMMAAKNPLLGIPICFVWNMTLALGVDVVEEWMWIHKVDEGMLHIDNSLPIGPRLMSGIRCLLWEGGLYDEVDSWGLTGIQEYSSLGPISNIAGIFFLVLLIVMMLLFVVYISKKRELSSGKLLYSSVSDIGFVICLECMVWFYGYWTYNYFLMLCSTVIILLVNGYYFYYKRVQGYTKWEVK